MVKQVYIGMTADIIHPGIINIINEAKSLGELTIGLLTDKAITEHKRIPFLSFEQRKQVVQSIQGVKNVIEQNEWDYSINLQKLKSDIIVHGDDWKVGSQAKIRENVINTIKQWGGELVEIPYTQGINSSDLYQDIKKIGITPNIRLKSLRRLLDAKELVRVMEAHDGLSSLIVENLTVETDEGKHKEYDAMWSSSLTDSTSKGKPDIEAVDLTTRFQTLNDILECTTKPIIYDGDTGGKIEHFVFSVRSLERHGISAIIIEDKVGLKRNSLFGTEVKQELATIEEFCEKISTGKKAQITEDFMIIARIESLIAGNTIEDALMRATHYVQAGADGIMIHSKDKTGTDIIEFIARFRQNDKHTPIILVPTTYNHITEQEFIEMGANVVIYANHMLRSAYPAMVETAKSILQNSRSLEADKNCMPIKEILTLIPESY